MPKVLFICIAWFGGALCMAQNQQGVDEPLLRRLRVETAAGCEQASQALSNVRFNGKYEATYEDGSEGRVVEFDFRVDYPNNNYIVKLLGDVGKGRLKVRNADYAFEVLPSMRPGEFMLDRAILPDSELTETKFYGSAFGCEAGWAVGPTLLQSFLSDDFVVKQCHTTEVNGQPLVKLSVVLRPGVKDRPRFVSGIETVIFLDPARSWLLDHAEQFLDNKLVATYQCSYDDAERERVIKFEYNWIGQQTETFTVDVSSVRAEPLVESECRLPHYGISEESLGLKPPSRLLQWVLAAVGVTFIVLAVLKKRRP